MSSIGLNDSNDSESDWPYLEVKPHRYACDGSLFSHYIFIFLINCDRNFSSSSQTPGETAFAEWNARSDDNLHKNPKEDKDNWSVNIYQRGRVGFTTLKCQSARTTHWGNTFPFRVSSVIRPAVSYWRRCTSNEMIRSSWTTGTERLMLSDWEKHVLVIKYLMSPKTKTTKSTKTLQQRLTTDHHHVHAPYDTNTLD